MPLRRFRSRVSDFRAGAFQRCSGAVLTDMMRHRISPPLRSIQLREGTVLLVSPVISGGGLGDGKASAPGLFREQVPGRGTTSGLYGHRSHAMRRPLRLGRWVVLLK